MRKRKDSKTTGEVTSSIVARRSSRRKRSPSPAERKTEVSPEVEVKKAPIEEVPDVKNTVEDVTNDKNRVDNTVPEETPAETKVDGTDQNMENIVEEEKVPERPVAVEDGVMDEKETSPPKDLVVNEVNEAIVKEGDMKEEVKEEEGEFKKVKEEEFKEELKDEEGEFKEKDEENGTGLSDISNIAAPSIEEDALGACQPENVEAKKSLPGSEEQESSQPDSDPKNEKSTDESRPQLDASKFQENTEDISRPPRKRKWISKKATETKETILAISSDSLKDLVSGVNMVPLSDIKLDSSSEVETTQTDREEGENSPTPERKLKTSSVEQVPKETQVSTEYTSMNNENEKKDESSDSKRSNSKTPTAHSKNILYITNLVRPFTVMQLKGLLARTGKIVENGFWIDRIKSKCYVEYETEEEAIETRHALHGVRWPVSNPKCLHVEFGKKESMKNAIMSNNNLPNVGSENYKDNYMWNASGDKDGFETVKKISRNIREWDVGKKDNNVNDREKMKEKTREFDHRGENGTYEKAHNMQNNVLHPLENGKDSKGRIHDHDNINSGKKPMKKEADPPIRLLDDLFRKTKTTPCVYWLPLTPEQISEKEMFRMKRIEEHKERVKQREQERVKERERELERERGKNRVEKERERNRERPNNNSDRQRSRSRDRRR